MITKDKSNYLKGIAKKSNQRFLRCEGVMYEVSSSHYANGPSPLWSVEEVQFLDVPPPPPLETEG